MGHNVACLSNDLSLLSWKSQFSGQYQSTIWYICFLEISQSIYTHLFVRNNVYIYYPQTETAKQNELSSLPFIDILYTTNERYII